MAEQNNARKKDTRTPEEKTFQYNAGAAYAVTNGDLLGGMYLTLGNNRAVMEEPLVQRAFTGAEAIEAVQRDYSQKMKEWGKGGEQGDAPKVEQTPELDAAAKGHEDLLYSAQMRKGMFDNAYTAMSIGQATNAIFYNGKLPKNTPKEIGTLLDENKDIIVKDADGKLEKTLQHFYSFHLNANVHKKVQEMYLENSLKFIVNEE
jgi:hypothetical protein